MQKLLHVLAKNIEPESTGCGICQQSLGIQLGPGAKTLLQANRELIWEMTTMHRRQFMAGCFAASAHAALGSATEYADRAGERHEPLELAAGPQLFLDDFVVARMDGIVRRVEQARRQPKPVLDSKTFGTTQPYLTILRDGEKQRYRIWYNKGPAIGCAESTDGLVWTNPQVAWNLPRSYGASLVDDGPSGRDPARRFKLANWQATRSREDRKGDDGGMYVGFSPDGLRWQAYDKNPVLAGWPEGYGKISRYGVGDIVDVCRDHLRGQYVAAVKLHALPEDGYAKAPRAGGIFRRLVGMSTSKDFVNWSRPVRIFTPDAKDEGLLEFYGMGGMHQRGGLTIGFVRVLRDDLSCEPGGPKDGIGYSALAFTRDGINWTRLREPFLDRNPEPKTWDRAMSWIGGTLPIVIPAGERLYFYYGGYARGHKVAAQTERQIGMARISKDRYVAMSASERPGTLRTKPLTTTCKRLTVNTRSGKGELRVRLLDEKGQPSALLGVAESKPISADVTAAEVHWHKPMAELRGRPFSLEFQLRDCQLFAFKLHDT